MKLLPRRARSVTGPVATVTVIAVAALIWHQLPTPTDVYAPFPVAGVPGAAVAGRNLTVTVTGARISSKVTADSVLTPAPVSAVGQWIVVGATMLAATDPAVPRAMLIAGPNTYRPTDRLPPGTTLGAMLQPAVAESGAWVFDVPPTLLDPDDEVMLQIWDGDGRLDTRLDITLTLSDTRVSRMDTVDLKRPIRAVP